MNTAGKTRTRSIRVLVAKPGLDGHDVGAKLVVRALLDAGMDAMYSGLRKSPEEIADAALREKVDAVGLSVLSGAHLALTEKVKQAMQSRGLTGTLLMVGGNIPAADVSKLRAMGADAVFPVGTPFQTIVSFLEERVES